MSPSRRLWPIYRPGRARPHVQGLGEARLSASRGSSKKDQVDEEAPDSINERYLQTGPDGLTSVEGSRRLQEFGYNRLEEKVTPSWIKFLKQVWRHYISLLITYS